jgi:hypothetical protein
VEGQYAKQVLPRLLTALLGVAAFFAAATRPALTGENPSAGDGQAGSGTSLSQPPAQQPGGAPQGGMIIYIDPQTGAIRQDPAPGTVPLQLSPQERNAFGTSHEGLVQAPSAQPGGGVKLDLQGRFQSPLIGTIDGDGQIKTQHLGDTPGSGDKK